MSDDLDVVSKAKLVNRNSLEKKIEDEAVRLNIPYLDLRKAVLSKELLENFDPKDFFECNVVPIKEEEGALIIGSTNPKSKGVEDFKKLYRKDFPKISAAMISSESFKDNEDLLKSIVKNVPPEAAGEVDVTEVKIKDKSFEEFQKNLDESEIQKLLKILVVEGFALGASDIHIEPRDDVAKIRFRMDGVLHDAGELPKKKYKYLLSQVELRSGLKLNANYPQNGRFKVKFESDELAVRIEVMPSLYGADIVIRIFNVQAELLDINQLGIRDVQLPLLESSLIRPHGMIMVVGPTGSGKTTTIYSILNKLNSPEIKLITLEDPIEYNLAGATQSQINEKESFNERLKAVLREDPDIIMVGEIRDAETAKTALQAAITGHLLITTLHANDAVTAVPRIIGLVEDASTFLDAVNIIIAQRLVRAICRNCIEEYKPTNSEMAEINKILDSLPLEHKPSKPPKFFHGKGCEECAGIGYKGRIGIFELLQVSPGFQKAVVENATLHELKQVAEKDGMLTMEQDGFLKAIEGKVDIVEVLKVIKE
ncbi:type II/IV secretion system protein [candidate division WS5 bacterium]|uniref:Type II/IV secretion system protein n=1 Tax=candidate division WS5 bacterium TaxID=2093353 RepID=A0A419DGN2_9BACT|nr:MAG: type II/IV secretion system protein [candidate division WS5 bacterium]